MTHVFAFIAGLLTTLSPCVVPVLPFVTNASLNRNRWAPIMLTAGLMASFVGVTVMISATGFAFGLSPETLRTAAGALLIGSGSLLLFTRLSEMLTTALSSVTSRLAGRSVDAENMVFGELMNGALLGVIWTPCSGPTLGAALGLATQEATLGKAVVVLCIFGLGAAIPLLAIAYGTRRLAKGVMANATAMSALKKTFGVLIVALGLLVLFGADRAMEAALLNLLPEVWLELITEF